MLSMRAPNDGKRYDPNDPEQQECLRRAECYIDYSVNPPVIRYMKDERKYEIIGWVWLTTYGELKAHGVKVEKGDGKYFIYKNKKFPPGIYYLIRKDGREVLISQESFEAFLDS
ncbi:hypothetical protein [Sulfolobus spindle-shaped virus]|nr:hypothetical protein [Sulfolobus spindle-shaped virus]